MSDFDKIINDRLNEDDGEFFPRKEANWDKLSQRLADFDKANPLPNDAPQPIMRPVWKHLAWTSAAAVLIGVSSLLFWHFNEVNRVQQENERLQQEVTALKQDKQSVNPTTVLEKENGVKSETFEQTTKTPLAQSKIADSTKKSLNSTPSVFEEKQDNLKKNKQNATVVATEMDKRNNKSYKNQNPKEAVIQRKNERQIAEMDKNKALNAVPFDKRNEPLKQQKTQLDEAIAKQTDPTLFPSGLETNKSEGIKNKPNEVTLSPETDEERIKTDRKNIENIETTVQKDPSVSNPILDKKEGLEVANTDALASEKAKQDSLSQALIALQKGKSDAESVTPPIIKTDKGLKRWQSFLPKGFAIGAHGTYGSVIPKIPGVMGTTGKGLSAELALTKNINVALTGDFLVTQFELRERPHRFRLPDAPDPQKPNVGLHHIQGEQKSRMLSVNAKYVVGKEWWVQPFLTLGHSWLKIDEHEVNFVFKDFTTGQEIPSQAKVNTEKVKSLWQAGFGLEKRIKRWTFGVSAEIQKDFSNPTDRNGNSVAVNFGVLRGGIKFNIF